MLGLNDEARTDVSFVGGAWHESDEGVIGPPENLADENLAFFTREAYRDFQAEFEFRWDLCDPIGSWAAETSAGFLFRAEDARHYYAVHFPGSDQELATEYFWGMISRVDASGFVEVLKAERVPGVSTALGQWHKVRVVVEGDQIMVRVDGRPMTPVVDATYRDGGRIGLATNSGLGATPKSSFRNLRVSGPPVPAPAWDESVQPGRNWSVVDPRHSRPCSNIVRASTGELLVVSGGRMLASPDNGRTWSAGEPLPAHLQAGVGWETPGSLRPAPDGGLELYGVTDRPPLRLRKATSADQGRTWSEIRDVARVDFPSDRPFNEMHSSGLLELAGGDLLVFLFVCRSAQIDVVDGRMHYLYPAPGTMDICLRSADGGETWGPPVNLDGPPHDDERWMFAKDTDLETSKAQTRDGRIIRLSRPFYSPFMWESWSEDRGRTWTPAARGAFPMFACTESMVCTASGALLIAGRFPGMAVQVSRDDGMTWACYRIDATGIYANGAMYEVEPDVVVFLYGGWLAPEQLRCQLLRVSPTGLEPVRDR